jgi:hypothetical protein
LALHQVWIELIDGCLPTLLLLVTSTHGIAEYLRGHVLQGVVGMAEFVLVGSIVIALGGSDDLDPLVLIAASKSLT